MKIKMIASNKYPLILKAKIVLYIIIIICIKIPIKTATLKFLNLSL